MANTTKRTAGNTPLLRNIKRACNKPIFAEATRLANEMSLGHALEWVLEAMCLTPGGQVVFRNELDPHRLVALPSEMNADAEVG